MKRFLLPLFGLLALAGCDQQTQTESTKALEPTVMVTETDAVTSPICASELMPGGWQATKITDEAKEALKSALAQMENNAQLKDIIDVRSQVVNGVNYAIEFEMDDGSIWNAIIYRSLEGDYLLTQPAKQGKLCE
ncbi:2-oxoglutarate dehydrogenase [Vibrio anguillarum]|uniref:cystatin domain-containing protein n=1 Tax=Vibrio anguillarum TaxID=55601 RepID=UPI00188CC3BD|nr:cystatin domain-containing protein [Vibrio anguillarum]MBF4255779.1 2-oxoglutarate dehydrogenase [Vibrio anguillarum]MBF4277425.1 2-oxoglutarate dehydrogenase [Vibrio anguillarum]MBF4299119.1 2-oxoglutarate dehydrogenase [Vibrio anguillarum]MBF4361641.1 2-oxoglutarate dehydrogenase [Vibrio anguillarum]MBF4396538.1 2-oxoglutarate dehydrogenase [Vibrio anguillarum]